VRVLGSGAACGSREELLPDQQMMVVVVGVGVVVVVGDYQQQP
jgi:hypothetical protein